MAEPERACLAVDIGGTTTRAAVIHGTAVAERREMPTDAPSGPDDLIRRLVDLLESVRPGGGGLPLGVSCTGRVDQGHVTAVNTATMPGWVRIPLQDRLAATFGPVRLINDAKAATLAEWTACPDRSTGNFLFVTVSTGIGSGLVLNGRLHHARSGRDIGLGFTRTSDGRDLEDVASGRAFGRLARTAGYGSVITLFDAAEAGSASAQEVLRAPLTELAQQLLNLHCLLGLDRICLGGSVGLRQHTQMVLRDQLQRWLPEAPELYGAVHGADAGLIGAARLVLQGNTA